MKGWFFVPQLELATTGVMSVSLQGATFGQLISDPRSSDNVKTFELNQSSLYMEVNNENQSSPWANVVVNVPPNSGATMTVTINTNAIGWYGTAEFVYNPQDIGLPILKDTFKSEPGGVPNSGVTKTYRLG